MRLQSTERLAVQGTGEAEAQSATMRIGELLGLLPEQTADVLSRQARTGELFGEIAVDMEFATPEDIERALFEQAHSRDPGDASKISPAIVMAYDDDDPISKCARDLRLRITAQNDGASAPPRRVVLLSLDGNAEAAILAANLAVACARGGLRTLLIDADLDTPVVHDLFAAQNEFGISTLLSSQSGHSFPVQPSSVKGLSLVTAGPTVSGGRGLLEQTSLALVTERATDRFEKIIVVGGEADTLGILCAKGFDAAMLVVRRGVTMLNDVASVADRIHSESILFLGTVVVD